MAPGPADPDGSVLQALRAAGLRVTLPADRARGHCARFDRRVTGNHHDLVCRPERDFPRTGTRLPEEEWQ